MRTKWMQSHVCQDPVCADGDCTLDRWYPNAPLTTPAFTTIRFALAVALDEDEISQRDYNIALLELSRGMDEG